jgi:hypothetical protein
MSDTKKNSMINELVANFGPTVNRNQMMTVAAKYGINPGFLTKNKVGRGVYDISEFVSDSVNSLAVASSIVQKTDEELLDSMRRRFRTLDRMAAGVVAGRVRSMIVSGPAGIGKTYTIEGMLESAADDSKITYQKISGYVKPTGIFKALWNNRHDNSVILIDDADSAFGDEVALNLLKTALDSGKRRMITWGSEKIFMDEVGEEIPSTFEFRGSVIFITNLNFETMIAQGKSLAPHFQALISRSFYIDLNFDSAREYILRIEDVLRNTDMAYTVGLNDKNVEYLISYIKDNANRMRELSLRMVLKMANILSFADSIDDFEDIAGTTCLRRK